MANQTKNMKTNLLSSQSIWVLTLLIVGSQISGIAQWKPAGDKIKTQWATEIEPQHVLPEYPRPMMEREQWKNLNGLWDYAIRAVGEPEPLQYDGKILVPFAVESSLSGVMKSVGSDKVLWYRTVFDLPEAWGQDRVLLHFGAVDWQTEVWLNGVKIGGHIGGYTPFTFDLSPFLLEGSQNLVVKVWDPTDEGPQPRGKQVNKPEGIWYTAVTGIWQTVWLEPVPRKYLTNVRIVPDLDNGKVNVSVTAEGTSYGDVYSVTVKVGAAIVSTGRAVVGTPVDLPVPEARTWSPESPFLYDLGVGLESQGTEVDRVKSYFGMRKIALQRNDKGIVRIQLNNKDYFHFGPLDQGWWPDGLYTAPTDEALRYDIVKTKELGFNMIRKHVKVEPARWYAHCDRSGILVWQDMPSGDKGPRWERHGYFKGTEFRRSPESERIYKTEWKDVMDHLYSHPSIVVWVPFNESWGQFKTEEISDWTKAYDPGRLVNPASGGNFYRTGDILDLHNYPEPKLYLYDAERATVLGEYGGIGLPLQGHLWRPDDNWGYVKFKDSRETTRQYVAYAKDLEKLAIAGFSAAVYTQTTDVEGEVNGFMTYDRKVDKMNVAEVKKANESVIKAILGD